MNERAANHRTPKTSNHKMNVSNTLSCNLSCCYNACVKMLQFKMWQAACANEEEYNERDYWTDIFGENVTDSLKVWAGKKKHA